MMIALSHNEAESSQSERGSRVAYGEKNDNDTPVEMVLKGF